MAEFVAALRSKHPKANVMLATRARSVTLPATILKEAGLAQTLEGACMSAAGEYDVRVREFSGNGQPVYSITAHEKRRSSARKPANVYPRKIPSVYSLSELTMQRRSNVAPFSVKTIMSAIDLAMSHLDTPPRMKFHEDSGLLLISGSAEHTHIVEETLAALRRDLQTREKSGTRRAQPQKGGK